jgi:hypothetical protein
MYTLSNIKIYGYSSFPETDSSKPFGWKKAIWYEEPINQFLLHSYSKKTVDLLSLDVEDNSIDKNVQNLIRKIRTQLKHTRNPRSATNMLQSLEDWAYENIR